MKRPSIQVGLGIALGAGIGLAVAVILGSGGAWLAIGIALGVIVGNAMSKSKQKEVHGRNKYPPYEKPRRVGHPNVDFGFELRTKR